MAQQAIWAKAQSGGKLSDVTIACYLPTRHGPLCLAYAIAGPGGLKASEKFSALCRKLFGYKGGVPPCQGRLAQLVRAPVSHTGGHAFESHTAHAKSAAE